jgi:hypothetical protein
MPTPAPREILQRDVVGLFVRIFELFVAQRRGTF